MRTRPGTTARRLLAHLIREGPAHRADLSRALGVSRTTITNLASELTGTGVLAVFDRGDTAGVPADAVAEVSAEVVADAVAESPSGSARPPLKQPLGIPHHRGVLVSVVFRMTSIAIVVGTLDGRMLGSDEQECAREQRGAERLQLGRTMFEELLASCELDVQHVLRLHLAVNAQCDRESGEVIAEQAAGPWRGVNPKAEAATWSPAPVIIENTARLVGLAEYHALPAPRPRSLVYVHLSWGITMGQVVGGEIVAGSHGGAGELGHVSIDPMGPPCACANRGCLMLYTGLDAVTDRIRATLGEGTDIADAVAAMEQGSHACSTIIADAGETVGRALATVCNIVDPDAIVLGGELATAGAALSEPVQESLRRRALPLVTRTLTLSLATTAGDPLVAGSAALRAMREDPALIDELVAAVLAQ